MPDDQFPEHREFQRIIDVRRRRGLTSTQKFVLVVLCSHRIDFQPTVRQLADDTGFTVRCVQKTMNELVAMGLAQAVASEKCRGGQRQRFRPVVAESANVVPASSESANVVPSKREPDSHSDKESEKEDSVLRTAAAAAVVEPIPIPPVKQLFSKGMLDRLQQKTGRSEPEVRKLLGMMRSGLGAGEALEIAIDALGATMPWDFMTAAYHTRRGNRKSGARPMASHNEEILRRIEQAERCGAGMGD